MNYKINSANKEEYKFGNKLTAGCLVYCLCPLNRLVIGPNLGLLYEHSGYSELSRSKIDLTEGKILQGAIDAEISFSRVAVGLTVQFGCTRFRREANERKVKGVAHVSFAF